VGGLDAEQALVAARALDRANDYGPALRAYDLHVRLVGGPEEASEDTRLERARVLVRNRRADDAIEEFRALSTSSRERIGAVALDEWAEVRAEQGRSGDVETLRGWLLERYPTSAEAADVLFFRGDTPHDRNDVDAAAAAYRRLIAAAPGSDRAGLASMRVAQIHLLKGERTRAAEAYEAYLSRFPNGRRWQEASYWAARIRQQLGDDAQAGELLGRLRREDPLSYYSVLAAELVGERFRLDLPPGEQIETPAWLAEGIERVDLLRAAGLAEGELAEIARLTARAKGDQAASIALAEALIERDHTIPAINIGFELRRTAPWTVRLAKIIYPWHYQELFEREAREDGVDPYLTAALARQESAFDPDIVSRANAVGLMQLLPSTAAQVARQRGPQGFRDELLTVPDVNVHLGTIHLRDLLEENDGDITRFLAGYNAGQHRVVRWRDFSEAKDPLTFTERIPFAETRDYVKAVRRNLAIYQALYGGNGRLP
jgi:soluble lytic murein transglycosylase